MIEILSAAPTIEIDLVYTTRHNFMGQAVYPSGARAFLVREAAEALAEVQSALLAKGLGLKVKDAYRPISVQKIMWERFPDDRYVARPVFSEGKWVEGSKHNRGAAVDVVLIDLTSRQELEKQSEFDEFTERAHRNYLPSSKVAVRHSQILESTMRIFGFIGLPTEWWHFDWRDFAQYPLQDLAFSEVGLT